MVELGRLGCMETKAMKKIVLSEFLFVNQVFYFKQLLVGACLIITEFSPSFLSISLNRQDILFCSNEGTLKM